MGKSASQQRQPSAVNLNLSKYQVKRSRQFGGKNRIGKGLFILLFCVFVVVTNQKKTIAQEIQLTYNRTNYAEIIRQIKTQLNSGNVEQIRDALARIRDLNTPETARLAIDYLHNESEIVRATATFSILGLPAVEAANLLLPQLADKSAFVRRETAYALGKTGSSLAVNSLIKNLQADRIIEVRAASAVALGEIGDVGAINALDQIIQKNATKKKIFSVDPPRVQSDKSRRLSRQT